MNNKPIHDMSLKPLEVEGYELAFKNFVLFSIYDEDEVICLNDNYLDVSFDYLSKNSFEQKVIFLTEKSFEALYNKYLESKADKEIMPLEDDNFETSEEEFDVADFLKTSSDILTSEESAPVIKFVNSLFYQAMKKRASDIHIELHEFKGEVRFRVDGVLAKHIELDKKIMNLVVSRLKVMSNIDISETRIPQDGRISIKLSGKTLDIRVSVLPTFYGERVVMRILMQSEDIPKLEELGFDENVISKIEKHITQTYGMILVTGPTGSGKSTTLHSVLQKIVNPQTNIITVEDPVEYKSDEINQIQVNEKVGLSFASGLRSILRQDPDVIMVGEIRDKQTAEISVQSALTGHLVLSTLHTNSAPSAITRLIDMDVEKFLISSAVLGVLAQRLVRVLCPTCKEEDKVGEFYESKYNIKDEIIYKAKGCEKCDYSGYLSRKAVGEFFEVTDKIKMALKDDIDDKTLSEIAQNEGMIKLKEKLKTMVIKGQTSLEEAIRVGL
ncbi:MAG: GspE/PulE family protein [Campylobacterota bacterium]